MTDPRSISPLDHPAAWKATDFSGKDDFVIELTPRHIDAMKAGLGQFAHAMETTGQATSAAFPLTAIAEDVAAWRRILHQGRGMFILRGFPITDIDPEEMRLMYLGLGTHFGRPVSQSMLGDLVGDVVNVGGKDKNERAYRNSRELKLHTDRCDHIGMLCLRPAMQGGVSGYASAVTIHNIMLAERPDLLAHLYNGFYHHLFGEQKPGDPPVTTERVPIFSVTDGVPCVIYIRGYIDLAVEEGHVQLSEGEIEALSFLDDISNREDVRINFMLEPGEISFTNNCLLLHTRTEFEDYPDKSKRRHLLRLWLREDDRPSAPGVILHKGKAGIEKREGKGTYYVPAP